MYYLLLYDYVEEMLTRREPIRPAHFEHANAAHAKGLLRVAGAFGDAVDGAVLVFKADSREEVEAFARADPYVTSGLVTAWRVRPWTVVVGDV